eukprot:1161341-Pelagomonas_calceolata.AAC.9
MHNHSGHASGGHRHPGHQLEGGLLWCPRTAAVAAAAAACGGRCGAVALCWLQTLAPIIWDCNVQTKAKNPRFLKRTCCLLITAFSLEPSPTSKTDHLARRTADPQKQILTSARF